MEEEGWDPSIRALPLGEVAGVSPEPKVSSSPEGTPSPPSSPSLATDGPTGARVSTCACARVCVCLSVCRTLDARLQEVPWEPARRSGRLVSQKAQHALVTASASPGASNPKLQLRARESLALAPISRGSMRGKAQGWGGHKK